MFQVFQSLAYQYYLRSREDATIIRYGKKKKHEKTMNYRNDEILPGQSWVLQASSFVASPAHLPPLISLIFTDLVFFLVPPPHDREHNSLFQRVHSQSTGTAKFNIVMVK